MTKDTGLQVSSRRLIRERVGLIVNGTNAAAAIKTIAAAEVCLRSANLDDQYSLVS